MSNSWVAYSLLYQGGLFSQQGGLCLGHKQSSIMRSQMPTSITVYLQADYNTAKASNDGNSH